MKQVNRRKPLGEVILRLGSTQPNVVGIKEFRVQPRPLRREGRPELLHAGATVNDRVWHLVPFADWPRFSGWLTAAVHERRRASAQVAVNRATNRCLRDTPMAGASSMGEKPGRHCVITTIAVDRDLHLRDVRAAPSRATAGYTAARMNARQTKRSRGQWHGNEPAKRRDSNRLLNPNR